MQQLIGLPKWAISTSSFILIWIAAQKIVAQFNLAFCSTVMDDDNRLNTQTGFVSDLVLVLSNADPTKNESH